MLASFRRGATAFRPLQLVSFPVSTAHAIRSTGPSQFASKVIRFSPAVKSFSSITRHLQQNVATQAAPEETQEFSKFQELADAGVVSPVVISTITNNMDIHTMTEVQRMTLNQCLNGEDVIAQAKTGTGKTLAFLLPIIQRILRHSPQLERYSRGADIDIRGLIISPTRELAEQIAVEAKKLVRGTGIIVQTAVGGTQKSMHLRLMQREGCHILVGTPGRVNDILSDSRSGVRLDNIETFVLDEADRLLDIGFMPAIEEIQSYMPRIEEKTRQTLMFSATVPKSVVNLVRQTMRPNFKFVRTVDLNEAPTHERIPQNVVFLQGLQNQPATILEIATNAIEAHKRDPANNLPFKAIVYYGSTNEVDMAFHIFSHMQDPASGSQGRYAPHPLAPTKLFRMNGKLSQALRTAQSEGFRRAESALLFSSDVTARGMDFPNVSHVIQLGLPKNPDDYIHRLGRTGRAGKPGEGWLLLNKDEHHAYRTKMEHPGMRMNEVELQTASLDMTQPAKLPANVAKFLQIVEVGVKNVPHNTKVDVYRSLLGVLPQQFPNRQKQDQIDMMNELARFGWGMQTPPALSRNLVSKLGYGGCRGIEYESDSPRGGRFGGGDRSGGGDRFDSNRSSRRGGFDTSDPFGFSSEGKGVFGGGRDSFGRNGGNNDRGGFRSRDSSDFGGRSRSYDRNFGDQDQRRGSYSDRGRRNTFGDS